MNSTSNTVIIWGAGATASLGMRTTGEQARFIRDLVYSPEDSPVVPLINRIPKALGPNINDVWISALRDLLIVLGERDDGEPENSDLQLATVTNAQMAAMRCNWDTSANDEELRSTVVMLRTLYDWLALKAIVRVCPADEEGTFRLVDLFNVLDMHSNTGHGLRTRQGAFLTPQRVTGAQNALKMLLQAVFYIDWQHLCRDDSDRQEQLRYHYEFAEALGRRMQQGGLRLAKQNLAYDSKDFYMADVSFVSMNYDPIALWCQFVANRQLNRDPKVPHVGNPGHKLQIYHDLGHFVATRRVERRAESGTLWHPMNQSSAQRLNDPDHGANERARISKFLFPHGCLWWRECPNCGKLSSYLGHTWEIRSRMLIPPPPLQGFVDDIDYKTPKEEEQKQVRGAVDVRACVHCGTLTYAHHTPVLMQSNFKGMPPPFIQEIQRDLYVAVQEASHIVFMGYSLPDDDVDYRVFFATRQRRAPRDPVKCSVVVGKEYGNDWLGQSQWTAKLEEMEENNSPRKTLEAARDLFGGKNVRFYGGGIPEVFLDGGDKVTDAAVSRLLNWESTEG